MSFLCCIQARKSPTVDGKVERNSDGKEIRFPVILTFREKEIARRIVLGFKQWVCGFDILRVQEEGHSLVSYVCGKLVGQIEGYQLEDLVAHLSNSTLILTLDSRREWLQLCEK